MVDVALAGKGLVSGAARTGAKAAFKSVDEVGTSALKVIWIDENVGLKGSAKMYNDGASEARSNILSKLSQAPAIVRKLPDGTFRPVKFDGIDGNILIDRKISIVTTKKAKDQAIRCSRAEWLVWTLGSPNPSSKK